MQTAEFNHNDFSNTAEADKALMVRFFYKNVENKMESQAQGRPIFKEKTYIEIRIAGQRDAQACSPCGQATLRSALRRVRETHRATHRRHAADGMVTNIPHASRRIIVSAH